MVRSAPECILLNKLNDPILVDFDPARWIDVGANWPAAAGTTQLNAQLRPAPEKSGLAHDRSGDLYALGAAFYHVLTKNVPPTEQERAAALERGDPDPYKPVSPRIAGHSSGFLECIDNALELQPDNRLTSAAEWRRALSSSSVVPFPSGAVPEATASQSSGESDAFHDDDSHAAYTEHSEPDAAQTEPKASEAAWTAESDRQGLADGHAAGPRHLEAETAALASGQGLAGKTGLLITSGLVAVAALGVGAYFTMGSGEGAKPQTVAAAVTAKSDTPPAAPLNEPPADLATTTVAKAEPTDPAGRSEIQDDLRAGSEPIAPTPSVVGTASTEATEPANEAVANAQINPGTERVAGDEIEASIAASDPGIARLAAVRPQPRPTFSAAPVGADGGNANTAMALPVAARVPVTAMTNFDAVQLLVQAPAGVPFDVDLPVALQRSAYPQATRLAAPETGAVRPAVSSAPRDVRADVGLSQVLPSAPSGDAFDVGLPVALQRSAYPQATRLAAPEAGAVRPAVPSAPREVAVDIGLSQVLPQAPSAMPSMLACRAPCSAAPIRRSHASLRPKRVPCGPPCRVPPGKWRRYRRVADPAGSASARCLRCGPAGCLRARRISADRFPFHPADRSGAAGRIGLSRKSGRRLRHASGNGRRCDPQSFQRHAAGGRWPREDPRIAALPATSIAPGSPRLETLPPPAPELTPEASRTESIAGVTTAPAVAFPVLANPVDPTLVLMAGGLVGAHVTSGQRITSVNGVQVASIADVPEILLNTANVAVGDSVPVRLGIENPASGVTTEKDFGLPTILETSSNPAFGSQTRFENGQAVTTVVHGSGEGPSDLQRGDRLISLMPSKDPIDTPTALADLLRARISSGETQSSFAVSRKGSLWLVVLQHGA